MMPWLYRSCCVYVSESHSLSPCSSLNVLVWLERVWLHLSWGLPETFSFQVLPETNPLGSSLVHHTLLRKFSSSLRKWIDSYLAYCNLSCLTILSLSPDKALIKLKQRNWYLDLRNDRVKIIHLYCTAIRLRMLYSLSLLLKTQLQFLHCCHSLEWHDIHLNIMSQV